MHNIMQIIEKEMKIVTIFCATSVNFVKGLYTIELGDELQVFRSQAIV